MRQPLHRTNRRLSASALWGTRPTHVLALMSLCLSLTAGASSAQSGPDPEVSPIVEPQDWSSRLLAHCLDRRERWERSLADLERDLQATTPLSSKDLEFPNQERFDREKALKEERKLYFARLNFLMAGDKAKLLESPAEQFRQAAGVAQPKGKDAFLRALEFLFGDATACELQALQATLVFAYFGVSFTKKQLDKALQDEGILLEVEHAFHEHFGGNQDLTPETIYSALRSAVTAEAFQHVDLLTDRLAGIASSQVARARSETPYQDQAAQTQLEEDIRAALDQPEDNPVRERFPEGQSELDHLASQVKAFFRLAAEPARVRLYVHTKIEELEGALRRNVPDNELEWLDKRVEKVLYSDYNAILRLKAQSSQDVLDRVAEILNEWFQKKALSAVEKRLYDDPFSAYRFFVQTGGVVLLDSLALSKARRWS